MYAAAGGASLASRQARQRQRQQNKTKQQQAKLHPNQKAAHLAAEAAAAGIASTPIRHHTSTTGPGQHSKQFHQLPSSYLRAPQAHGRKLSSSYTAQSKLLLPIEEGDGQSVLHMHSHARTHSHAHGPPIHHHDAPNRMMFSPKYVHRHSGSGASFHHSHLQKSATATLPLVSQMDTTPPTTPLIAVSNSGGGTATHNRATLLSAQEHDESGGDVGLQMRIPHDSIIITPATPMASPGHVIRQQPKIADQAATAAEKIPLTSAITFEDEETAITPPAGQLERKCSVYRMRRSDATVMSATAKVMGIKQQQQEHQQQMEVFEPTTYSEEMNLIFKGLSNGHKWTPCAYCEEGICLCEHIECAQGRAAWLERGRRCSVQDNNPTACHRRWVKRNRIQDASLGGSSDDEDFLGVLRGPSTFANAFLYVGLGTIALGLVIAFVGTGEKGFKTVELRFIGPSLIGLGFICCFLRILFCICPSHCISSNKKARKKNGNKVDADHTTSLLRGENKRVSIARAPVTQQKYPATGHKRSNSKMLNEGMQALRQIATTSLFMQNEQKPSTNRVVPMIKEPDNPIEAPLEMKKIVNTENKCEINGNEDEDEENIVSLQRTKSAPSTSNKGITRSIAPTTASCTNVNEKKPLTRCSSKLSRQRVSLNQQHHQQFQQEEDVPCQHQQQSEMITSNPASRTSETVAEESNLLMETSLIVINPSKTTKEETTTNQRDGLTNKAETISSQSPPTTSMPIECQANHGSSSSTTYDLPPPIPHTYSSRALSSSSTHSSLLSSAAPDTINKITPLQLPTTLSACATMGPLTTSAKAPASSTSFKTATADVPKTNQQCILGQVKLETVTSPPALDATIFRGSGATKTSETTLSLLLPKNQVTAKSLKATLPGERTTEIYPKKQQTQPSISTSKIIGPSLPAKQPSPKASTSSGKPLSLLAASSGEGVPSKTTLSPPTAPSVKFEPELLLSPAKLGQ